MTPVELLSQLRKLDVKLWLEGERLRFSAPNGAMTPELRGRIVERKGEIVDFLRQANHAGPAGRIQPTPRDGALPLSVAQQRLWLLDQLTPGNTSYLIAQAVEVTGPLDVTALQQALDEVVRRHEVLRTTFPAEDGQPQQRISHAASQPLPLFDLSWLRSQSRNGELQRLIRQEGQRPFDLAQDRLLRTTLIRLGPQEHVILLTVHHIICDGWSLGVLVRELTALYNAFARGRPSPLADLPIQYADFAVWQWQRLQGDVLDAQLDYWKHRLDGAVTVLELPTDRPRHGVQIHRAAQQPLTLSKELSAALRDLGKAEDATIFMALLAAFQAFLHRYTGQDDILVGTAVANRSLPELEGLIGFFVNTLVMRGDLADDPSFRDFLAQVRRTTLDAFAHPDLPFERLVSEIQPARDLGRSPIFQAAFQLQTLPPQESAPQPTLSFRSLPAPGDAAKFDLMLSMVEGRESMTGTLEYSADLFDEGTMARLLRNFTVFLEGIVANPGAAVSRLPILAEDEADLLLRRWNDTAQPFEDDICFHEAFERQCARTPDAVAVVYADKALTYAELNRRANQLAHHLRGLGVGPGAVVGLWMDRSVAIMVGLLGILKAGGAYLPIDAGAPEERVRYMLADASAAAVVTHDAVGPRLRGSVETILVDLDTQRGEIDAHPVHNPENHTTPDNLAYVLYTSGTTGRPKGVMIAHRAVMNLAAALQSEIYADAGEDARRVSVNGPLVFDTSVKQIVQLLDGHALYIIPQELRTDADALLAYLAQGRIDVLDCTPAQLHVLLHAGLAKRRDLALRSVLVGGEAIDPVTWGTLARLDPIAFFNVYGPTECTVDATWTRITAASPPVIGRPIANVQAYVLDRHLQPTPIGVPGELCIGGAGLAHGYLGAPALTAQKFVPNPFGADGERLYRTGDLARWLPGGDIEFVGRVDHQVKIRGFRIEPGEIDAVLARHPDVVDVVTVAHSDATGQPQLVAYVAAKAARSPVFQGRRRHLLPNNLAVDHLNANETDFLYREMFEVRAYMQHGIQIADGDCIFDVGANIGMFTLFAHLARKDVRIFAFEPNPYVFERLRANAVLYGVDATLFPYGVGETAGAARFTFYPHFSFLSGLHADVDADKEVVRSFIRLQQQQGAAVALQGEETALLEELLDDRFQSRPFDVELRPLSTVIRDEGIERIDLLKINVEKSEIAVLRSVAAEDWPKIRQVVLEVHEIDGELDTAVSLLAAQGFHVHVERDWSLEETAGTNYYLYATRAPRDASNGHGAPLTVHAPAPPLTTGDLRQYLGQHLPDYMIPSAFVFLEALPLTHNGKMDRAALPAPDGSRADLGREFTPPSTPVEGHLAEIWQQMLGVERVGIHDNFFELGGDSMRIMQVVARFKQRGYRLTPSHFFEHPTIAELVNAVEHFAAPQVEQAPVTGPVPLTPIQHWFFEQQFVDPHHWNWSFLRRSVHSFDPALLAEALRHLIHHHDALRLRFHCEEDGWRAVNAGATEDTPFNFIDLSHLSGAALRRAIEARAAHAQATLDLSDGPLLRVVYFGCGGDEADRVLILFHHLVVDVVSTRILLEDLETILAQLIEGRPVHLPAKSTSFQAWAGALVEHAQSDDVRREATYWVNALQGKAAPLPLDFSDGDNVESSAAVVVAALDADATDALLHKLPAQGISVQAALLTALARALGHQFDASALLVEMEGHGREEIVPGVDVTRTVGWFTSSYPLRLAVDEVSDVQAMQRHLDQIPQRGIGYGLLRYLCQDGAIRGQMASLPRAQINFNYLGQLDQGQASSSPFHGAVEDKGPERSLRNRRTYPLYIVDSVRGGVLRSHWNFSANLHRRETIERWAKIYVEEVRRCVEAAMRRGEEAKRRDSERRGS